MSPAPMPQQAGGSTGGTTGGAKKGVRLDFTWNGLDCAKLNVPGTTKDNFIKAVEEGIVKGLNNPKITRTHIATLIKCARRLQAGSATASALTTESTIDANAAGVPSADLQSAVQSSSTSSAITSAVQEQVRASGGIEAVTAAGAQATVGGLTSAETDTLPTEPPGGCSEEICVTADAAQRVPCAAIFSLAAGTIWAM